MRWFSLMSSSTCQCLGILNMLHNGVCYHLSFTWDKSRLTEAVARQVGKTPFGAHPKFYKEVTAVCKDTTENSDSVYAFAVHALKSITSRKKKKKLSSTNLWNAASIHTERDRCINSILKILSISSSHTNGHPAVVPMVTALNHVVADGRRAGGLNLSSSILSDYWERERARQLKVPPC